jgi:hypothetical protein
MNFDRADGSKEEVLKWQIPNDVTPSGAPQRGARTTT